MASVIGPVRVPEDGTSDSAICAAIAIRSTAQVVRKTGLRKARLPVQVSCSMAGSPSGYPDARVEEDVADVRDQLRDEHDEDRHDRAGEKKLDVVVARRLHQRPPEALVVEERLDDDDAVQEPRKLEHDDRERRDERVPERMLHDDVGKAD